MGGLGTYVSCQISEFLFFLSCFFLLSSPSAQVAFLDRSGRSIRQTRVSGQGCAFWGSRQYLTTFNGSKAPKTSPKLARTGILQPNQRRDKMALYLSAMNIFVSILTDRLTTRGLKKKCKTRSIGVTRGSRDPISEFWDSLHITGTIEARNSKFGMQMDPEGN